MKTTLTALIVLCSLCGCNRKQTYIQTVRTMWLHGHLEYTDSGTGFYMVSDTPISQRTFYPSGDHSDSLIKFDSLEVKIITNADTEITPQQTVVYDTIKVPVNTVDTSLLLSVFINGWYRGHISGTQNGNSLAKDKIEFYKILNSK